MSQPIVKTVMTIDEINEWRHDWLLGHPHWNKERNNKICFTPDMLTQFLRDHTDSVLCEDQNTRPVYPGAVVYTPLELLLICRFNQLRHAAVVFLDAEKAHGGFFHPERLSQKRAAREELISVLAPTSGMDEPKWREKFNQRKRDGIDLAWQNSGPAA